MLMVLPAMPAFAQVDRWIFFGKTSSGERLFYDKKTFKHEKDRVEMWVRRVTKEIPSASGSGLELDPSIQKVLDDGLADTAERAYPESSAYREFQWVIFKDRTVKEYIDGAWSQRSPIRPETSAEHLWENLFVKDRFYPTE